MGAAGAPVLGSSRTCLSNNARQNLSCYSRSWIKITSAAKCRFPEIRFFFSIYVTWSIAKKTIIIIGNKCLPLSNYCTPSMSYKDGNSTTVHTRLSSDPVPGPHSLLTPLVTSRHQPVAAGSPGGGEVRDPVMHDLLPKGTVSSPGAASPCYAEHGELMGRR